MIKVLRYIFRNNSGFSKIHYLFLGVSFQLYKRITGGVISKKLFNGKSLFLYPHCNVSTMFAYTSIPDREEIILLRKLLEGKKESIFLDIGANIGSYSVCLMDVCSRTIAFEAHPFTAKRCKMNYLLNGKKESDVVELAVSDQDGTAFFSDHGGSSATNSLLDQNSGIEVKAITLDHFVKEQQLPPSHTYVVKVDVEGFEKNVFLGARDFLMTYPVAGIVFECFDTAQVFPVLESFGYKKITKVSTNNFFATKGD